jgi:hypothetical protein
MSSAQHREEVWKRAVAAGNGIAYCNLCTLPVRPGSDWHESHSPVAKTFGGKITGAGAVTTASRDRGSAMIRFRAESVPTSPRRFVMASSRD